MTRLILILLLTPSMSTFAGDGVERSKTWFARKTTIPTDIVVLDRFGQVTRHSGSLTFQYPRKTAYFLGSTGVASMVTVILTASEKAVGAPLNFNRIAEIAFIAETIGIVSGIYIYWIAEDMIYKDALFTDGFDTDFTIVTKGRDDVREPDRFRFFRRLFSVSKWRLPGSSDDFEIDRIALDTEEIRPGVLAINDISLQFRSLRTGDTEMTSLSAPQPKRFRDCLSALLGLLH